MHRRKNDRIVSIEYFMMVIYTNIYGKEYRKDVIRPA